MSLVIFFAFISPIVFVRAYSPKFNSEIWKNSIDENIIYGETPAHLKGEMVEDLIESKILIGKTKEQIESILGKNNFREDVYQDDIIWYFFQSKNILEGCDKIYIVFNDKISLKAGIGGCD